MFPFYPLPNQILSLMLTKVKDSRVQTLWNLVSYFEMIMGVGSKEVDPYRLLGLSVNASERDINKRWRTLSVKYHPDKVRFKVSLYHLN